MYLLAPCAGAAWQHRPSALNREGMLERGERPNRVIAIRHRRPPQRKALSYIIASDGPAATQHAEASIERLAARVAPELSHHRRHRRQPNRRHQ